MSTVSPKPSGDSGPDQGSDYESADESANNLNISEDCAIGRRGAASDSESGDDVQGASTPPDRSPTPNNAVKNEESGIISDVSGLDLHDTSDGTNIAGKEGSADNNTSGNHLSMLGYEKPSSALQETAVESVSEPTPEVKNTLESILDHTFHPDSYKVEPESVEIKPDSVKVEPDSKKVEPGSEKVESDSEKVEPESEKLEPESEKLEPDSEKVEHDSEKVEPDSVKIEPELVELGPESVKLGPESAIENNPVIESIAEAQEDSIVMEGRDTVTDDIVQGMNELQVDEESDHSEPPELISSTEGEVVESRDDHVPEGSAVEDDVEGAEDEADADEDMNEKVEGERGSADGQEQVGEEKEEEEEEEEPDDDNDIKNPAFIPRKGRFYEHDSRDQKDVVSEEKPGRSDLAKKWLHDRFKPDEQAPKTKQELAYHYGFDIRVEDKPPQGPIISPKTFPGKHQRQTASGDTNYDRGNRKPREYEEKRETQPKDCYNPKADDFPSLKMTAPVKTKLPGYGRGQIKDGNLSKNKRFESAPRGGFSQSKRNSGGRDSGPRESGGRDSGARESGGRDSGVREDTPKGGYSRQTRDDRFDGGLDQKDTRPYDLNGQNEQGRNWTREYDRGYATNDKPGYRGGGRGNRDNQRRDYGQGAGRGRGGYDRREEGDRGTYKTMEFRRSKDGDQQKEDNSRGAFYKNRGRGGYGQQRQQRNDDSEPESGDVRLRYADRGQNVEHPGRRNTSPPARGAKRYSTQRQQTHATSGIPSSDAPLNLVVSEMPHQSQSYDNFRNQNVAPGHYYPHEQDHQPHAGSGYPSGNMYGHVAPPAPYPPVGDHRFVVPQMYTGQITSSPSPQQFVPHSPIMPYDQSAMFYEQQSRMGAVPSMRQPPMMTQTRSKAIPIVAPGHDGCRAPPPSPPPPEPNN